jgi:hypothetical protein
MRVWLVHEKAAQKYTRSTRAFGNGAGGQFRAGKA